MDDDNIQVFILRTRHDHGGADVLANHKIINPPTPFAYRQDCFLILGIMRGVSIGGNGI